MPNSRAGYEAAVRRKHRSEADRQPGIRALPISCSSPVAYSLSNGSARQRCSQQPLMADNTPMTPNPAAIKTSLLRRRLLIGSSALAVVGLGAGTHRLHHVDPNDRNLHFANLDEAKTEIERLAVAPQRQSFTDWDWAQTLVHCAQSIEYSMQGFPQAKSALFQHTVGAAAFALFALQGRMHHSLAEPIPGAPALTDGIDAANALERVLQAIKQFQSHPGPLQPHFAYGELAKPDYEAAHAMHLAAHLGFFHSGV